MTDQSEESNSHTLDNQIYYFDIAAGEWVGRFQFKISDWSLFRRTRLGFVNRILAVCLHVFLRGTGSSRIVSSIAPTPLKGEQGSHAVW